MPALIVPASTSKSSGAASRSYHSVTSVRVTPEAGRDLADDAAPGHGQYARREQHRHVAQVAAEAHDVEEHHGLVVGVVVEHLRAADLLDPLADAREDQRERVVGEAGIDAVDEDRDAGLLGRGDHRRGQGVAGLGVLQHHRARGDDVAPGGEEALQVGQRLEDAVVRHGGVDDAVRLERQERVDVARRRPRRTCVRARPARRRRGPPCPGWRRRPRRARGRGGRRCRRGRGARRSRCSIARRGRAWRRLLGRCGRRAAGRAEV